jgi:hypothetical protein
MMMVEWTGVAGDEGDGEEAVLEDGESDGGGLYASIALRGVGTKKARV